ncbi:MAG TPA: hypothetical protein VGF34_04740 [Stellaceae bacterium]|jgi:hypothetical protein
MASVPPVEVKITADTAGLDRLRASISGAAIELNRLGGAARAQITAAFGQAETAVKSTATVMDKAAESHSARSPAP